MDVSAKINEHRIDYSKRQRKLALNACKIAILACSGAGRGYGDAAQRACQHKARKEETVYFGVQYYPEQWPEERWPIDAAMMQRAGVNTVRMGEFAWSAAGYEGLS